MAFRQFGSLVGRSLGTAKMACPAAVAPAKRAHEGDREEPQPRLSGLSTLRRRIHDHDTGRACRPASRLWFKTDPARSSPRRCLCQTVPSPQRHHRMCCGNLLPPSHLDRRASQRRERPPRPRQGSWSGQTAGGADEPGGPWMLWVPILFFCDAPYLTSR